MSTKDRILEEALTLFSERGYDGTGVDSIAERVGIKGPSLYKHFKGKEDILNSLLEAAELRYDESFGSEKNTGAMPDSIDAFIRKTMKRVRFTMDDPVIQKTRKLLVQEQFRDERLAGITSRHQIDGLVGMFEKIIGGMMKAGIFKEDDPSILAMELTAPAVVMIAKADRQPEYKRKMLKGIEKHIRHFCEQYRA